jgi:hypothetical protein
MAQGAGPEFKPQHCKKKKKKSLVKLWSLSWEYMAGHAETSPDPSVQLQGSTDLPWATCLHHLASLCLWAVACALAASARNSWLSH